VPSSLTPAPTAPLAGIKDKVKNLVLSSTGSSGGADADAEDIFAPNENAQELPARQHNLWEGPLLRKTVPALGLINVRDNARPEHIKQETIIYWNAAEALMDFGVKSSLVRHTIESSDAAVARNIVAAAETNGTSVVYGCQWRWVNQDSYVSLVETKAQQEIEEAGKQLLDEEAVKATFSDDGESV
jgi:hypothetical protein